jgi:hypothetical protein
MKFNFYYFIFYILYKFSWLADKKETKPEVIVQSAYLSLTLIVFFIILSASKFFHLFDTLLLVRTNYFIVYGPILILIYFINGKLFIESEKYLKISEYFDKKIKLNKLNIIILALFILFGSFSLFLCLMF